MNYFDHAASTPIYPEVLDIINHSMKTDFANPAALHILGHEISEKIEVARNLFLKNLGAGKNDQFIFTSSATESNNTVIQGLAFNKEDIILYCKADHPSLIIPVEYSKATFKEIILKDDGTVDNELFLDSLNANVKLVVLSHINNQNGVVNKVEELAKLVKEKTSAHIHIDAVQSFGKIDFKISEHLDSVAITSHKIGGPKGVAGLFLKNNHKVRPLLLGGGQENGFRSSTVAWPLIAGFTEAMKISSKNKEKAFSEACRFSEMIRAQLSMNIPGILFPFHLTSPFIVSFILPGVSSDIILRHLEARKVFISSTSACSSKIKGFNPGLAAMNIPEKFHKNFLRISLAASTTDLEVENLTAEFLSVWNELKNLARGR